MKLALSISIFLLMFNATAENVVCSLQTGNQKTSVVAKFSDLDEYGYGEFFDEKGVEDLSFNFSLDCSDSECEAGVIIDSQMVEDEVGSTGFGFERKASEKGLVFTDKLTNAPDGKDYVFDCYYNRKK